MAAYSKKAQDKVEKSVREMKKGKLTIGNSNKKIKSRKQAIAIGLSEAKKTGAKVPIKKSSSKKVESKKAIPKKVAAKKASPKKTIAKKPAPVKKGVAKKTSSTKKSVAKKASSKKVSVVKKVVSKKSVVKKSVPAKKQTVAKKTIAKKNNSKKASPVKKAISKKTFKTVAKKMNAPKQEVNKEQNKMQEPTHITAEAVKLGAPAEQQHTENHHAAEHQISPADIATIGVNNKKEILENLSIKHANSHKITNQKIAGKKPLW